MAPQDGVLMKILSRIKPESISFFPSDCCTPIAIDIGLNPPFPPSYIPQEFKVQFIMRLLEDVSIRHLF